MLHLKNKYTEIKMLCKESEDPSMNVRAKIERLLNDGKIIIDRHKSKFEFSFKYFFLIYSGSYIFCHASIQHSFKPGFLAKIKFY